MLCMAGQVFGIAWGYFGVCVLGTSGYMSLEDIDRVLMIAEYDDLKHLR